MKSIKLSSYQEPLKMVIYGKPGAGKSTFAKDMAKLKNSKGEFLRVAYIDFENASLGRSAIKDLTQYGVSLQDFRLFHPSEMKDLEEIVTSLRDGDDITEEDENGNEVVAKDSLGRNWRADALIIDSCSALNQDEIIFYNEVSKIRTKIKGRLNSKTKDERFVDEATAGLELKDRGNIKTNGTKIITNIIRKLDMHCVLIFREKNETETRRTGSGIEIIDTGNKILDSWQFATYEGNIVLRLDNDIDGTLNQYKGIVEKDRTGTFIAGEEVQNPTPLMWQEIIYEGVGKKSQYQDVKTSDDLIHAKVESVNDEDKTVSIDTSINIFLEEFKILKKENKDKVMSELSSNNIPAEKIKSRNINESEVKIMLDILEKNK
jgi:energy-coupling factor transporter ATP-binding protein EcfA2